jgi:hypothetical protein
MRARHGRDPRRLIGQPDRLEPSAREQLAANLDVAEHFQVSELTIRTLLVNRHRLEREELDEEFDPQGPAPREATPA